MRTLTPFIEEHPAEFRLLKAAGHLLIPCLLAGCVSLGEGPSAAKSSVPDGPSDHSAVGSIDSENTSNPGPAVAVPMPEVSEENASEFEMAVKLLQEERYSDAEVLLLGITADQPELAGPWINLGQVYVALGQPEEARRAFAAAVQANPWNCTAHNELGLLSRVNGDFEAAEKHYLNCLQNVPDNGPAYLNLGILYELYLGRLSDALASYRHYQAQLEAPDRRVQGWVMDLERRLGV